ncbi:MAG: sugar phosphate isomerase/epimerase family protein [Chitinophagaceae bacterium]
MPHTTRREFLQTSAMLAASAVMGSSIDFKKKKPLLSFSTLGCPDWSFQQTTDFAVKHGYKGIEIRGILRQMDLPKCNEFNTAESRSATMTMMKEKGLQFVDLGSSATLHFAEGAEREKNLAEGKRFIDLAQQISCPYIRVFPNNFPKGQERSATIDLIIKGLVELGDHAKGSQVTVLMETHGELVKSEDLELIMRSSEHPNVGLVWDPINMWTVTKEAPSAVYPKLKKYIRHTHIKDAKLAGDKLEYKFLGEGETPVFEAIDLLAKGGYKGYYSFEWEKLWHPEIAEPELAFADYPQKMKQHFK